jgi:LmbE family N-acetylglucosaminyl deacetylase
MNVLVFIAHPDDETILAGGTLALLARAGVAVHYLCATRGEGGEVGEPPLCARHQLGQVRERELACAVNTLGGRSLSFLDYVDPVAGEGEQLFPYTDDQDALTEKILAHIRRLDPVALITHGSNGEYGHPAHLLTHAGAFAAVKALGANAPLLYTFSASFPEHPRPRLANRDDPAHLVLDVSAVMPQKESAAFCHHTQNALFVRRSSRRAGRQMTIPEVLMRLEGLHRTSPPVNGRVDDSLVRLLKPWSRESSLPDGG